MKRKLPKSLASAAILAVLGGTLLSGTAHAATEPVAIKLKNWNGLCLTILNASPGQLPVQTGCTDAHAFEYDAAHANIFVQGHSTDCIASGPNGDLEIESCASNAADVLFDDTTKTNPSDGLQYGRIEFSNEGTYAHANGNGQPVTMITNPGTSLAVYWNPVL